MVVFQGVVTAIEEILHIILHHPKKRLFSHTLRRGYEREKGEERNDKEMTDEHKLFFWYKRLPSLVIVKDTNLSYASRVFVNIFHINNILLISRARIIAITLSIVR